MSDYYNLFDDKIVSFFEATRAIKKMAKEKGRLCFLYPIEDDGVRGWAASFIYRHNWLYKAYPGGRDILSLSGTKLARTYGCLTQ